MALSVKRFIHEIGCPEPSNQVSVNYHATSADELCAGNGTLSAIFSEAADLSSVVDGAENANAGDMVFDSWCCCCRNNLRGHRNNH